MLPTSAGAGRGGGRVHRAAGDPRDPRHPERPLPLAGAAPLPRQAVLKGTYFKQILFF